MADAQTELDLDALHAGILAGIAAQFPDVATVADYHADRDRLDMPAILVELEDLEGDPEEDPGTDQAAVRLRFRARVVLPFRTPTAQREIRRLCAALVAHINGNRWGQPIERAVVGIAAPDDFDPELRQAIVWSIEFEHRAHLGASVWTGDALGDLFSLDVDTAETPEQVFLGLSPNIGTGNAAAYQDVTPEDPE